MPPLKNAGTMNPAINLEPIAYSVADACRMTSIGKTRLYQLINAGKLEARKIGKRTIIPADSLRRLIAGEA